jgi:transcriptional regulator with XRE-family HTH domain
VVVLAGEQIRAARAILRWKASDLAEKAGVGLSTVQRGESVDGPAPMMRANMEAIRRALEAGGVQFIAENGGGAGVRLRKSTND